MPRLSQLAEDRPSPATAASVTPRPSRAGWLMRRAVLVCAAVVAVALLPQQLVIVRGMSMAPSLRPGQLLFLNRAAYVMAAPRRGDVVVFHHVVQTGEPETDVVKRVIGVPGDLVKVDTGRVFVNGARLDEPYVRDTDDYTYPQEGGPLRVPADAYFVLGDNRPISADSHLGWFVPTADVVGEAWALPLAI